MTKTLEQVLADQREELGVLRRHGHDREADSLARLCDDVTAAAEPYLRFISEREASIRAGKSERWIQSKYPELEREGHAKMVGRARHYRECAIPRRADVLGAREAGRAAARRAS
jgi:hypothetical protein